MIIFLLVVLVIVVLLVWAAGLLSPPLDATVVRIIQAVIVVGGVVAIAQRAGVLEG